MKPWEQSLVHLKEGIFVDELKYVQNQLLKLPIEEQPSAEELLEFINQNIKKDFDQVFVQWDNFKK
jgi:hypothetical protein